jgi:hypothetical protein
MWEDALMPLQEMAFLEAGGAAALTCAIRSPFRSTRRLQRRQSHDAVIPTQGIPTQGSSA